MWLVVISLSVLSTPVVGVQQQHHQHVAVANAAIALRRHTSQSHTVASRTDSDERERHDLVKAILLELGHSEADVLRAQRQYVRDPVLRQKLDGFGNVLDDFDLEQDIAGDRLTGSKPPTTAAQANFCSHILHTWTGSCL